MNLVLFWYDKDIINNEKYKLILFIDIDVKIFKEIL